MGYNNTRSCWKSYPPKINIFAEENSLGTKILFAKCLLTLIKRDDALTTPEYWFGTGSSGSDGSIIAKTPPEHLAVNKFSYEHGYAPMSLSVE